LLYQLSYRGTEGSFREMARGVQEGKCRILSDFTRGTRRAIQRQGFSG